uniref:TIGR04086 family membrane protein n=1 Tax=Ruminococcus bicirculans (ex Wegman et al. 2014) TaxID=1160721 RepID=UPI003FD8D250
LRLSVMATAALGFGAYAGGHVCGKRQRRNGLLSGVLRGVFIFLIIVILSALFSKAAESFSVPAKLVLTLVCAGVGGVVGVNSKSSRF